MGKGICKLKNWKNFFFTGLVCSKNLKRDIVILLIGLVLLMGAFFYPALDQKSKEFIITQIEEDQELVSEDEIYEEVRLIQESIDRTNWNKHQGQWYGFEIEYPENWTRPISQAGTPRDKWEYRYHFKKDILGEDDRYIGFDLVIYNLNKTKSLFETDEFPDAIGEADNYSECKNIKGHIIETGDYPAEEIYIQPGDSCYESVLFFSFTKGNYIYNIVPINRDDFSETIDPRVEISDKFPEFFEVAATLNPIDIVRPKVQAKPKITAPKPVSYKIVNGRMVCAKKNDKPSKSKKDKGKHLDMECCLDPDEYPNPWCYYDPKKYGKYL